MLTGTNYLSEEAVNQRYNFPNRSPFRIQVVAAPDTAGALVGSYDGNDPQPGTFWIIINSDRSIRFGRNATPGQVDFVSAPGVVSLGQLHTFTFVYDGSKVVGLLDGSQVVSGSSTGNLPAVSQPLSVGAVFSNDAPILPCNGKYFLLTIWGSAEPIDPALRGDFQFFAGGLIFVNGVSGATDVLILRTDGARV